MDTVSLTTLLQKYTILCSLTYLTDTKDNSLTMELQKAFTNEVLIVTFRQIIDLNIVSIGLGADTIQEAMVTKSPGNSKGQSRYTITSNREFKYLFSCGHSPGDLYFRCASFIFREEKR